MQQQQQSTYADISARAYEIWENRQRTGAPGTAETDWFEAERQLSEEIIVMDDTTTIEVREMVMAAGAISEPADRL